MLFDLLKSQRTSRGIRGWHCCVVPVKFHTEEKILHHTHTHTHTQTQTHTMNAQMHACTCLNKRLLNFFKKTTNWKLH